MDTIQVAGCQPWTYVKKISHLHHLPSKSCVQPPKFDPLSRTSLRLRAKTLSILQCMPCSKSRQPFQVCFAGGRGMMENNEDSPWKAAEKAMEKFKGQSMEDVLQQQLDKAKYDNGGNGLKPPRGGGGGSGNGSGGSKDGGFAGMSDETLQVVLATIGFIFLYIFFLSGEELTKLARDYIKYLYSGKQSVRLKRIMFKWGRLYRSLTDNMVDRQWLEKTILKRNCLESKSGE